MKLNCSMRLLVALALFWPAAWAHATITCTVTSPGFSTSYNATDVSTTVVQTYFTVGCTRGVAGDPTSVSYSVEASNGLNPSGTGNRAYLGTNPINYDLYRDSGCSSQWNRNNGARLPNPFPGTITLSGYVTTSVDVSYWGCVPAGQTTATNGIHTDTVTIYLYQGTSNTLLDTGIFPVNIYVGATCSITTAPGNITFNYTSFGPAANAGATFGATCTNQLPYTMALDATSGTLLGMNYSLSLSATSGTGTGAALTYAISGTMAAGQAGTCAAGTCSASQARTLIISY